jgi:O-antigen/teichoic acid export membrane protein
VPHAVRFIAEAAPWPQIQMTATSIPPKASQGAASAPSSPARSLAHGVFLMFGTKMMVQAFSIAGTIVLARSLGPAGRGAVAVALVFAMLLVQFGSLGLQSANLYFAARDPRRIGTIMLNSLWAMAVMGVLLVAITLLTKAFFPGSLRGLSWLDVVIVATGLPALFATPLLQSVFLAEGRVAIYNGVELAGSVVVCIGLVVGLLVVHIGVPGAIAVMLGANWGMVLTFLFLQRSWIPRLGRPDVGLMWRMLKYGFRLYATTFLAYMMGRVNLLLVNYHLGTTQAGFYAIGIAVGENLHLLPSIVPLNLFPRIARGETFESSAAVFRILFVVFGGLCLLTIPLVKPGLELLYGSRFAPAAGLYYWMLPGIFCYGLISVLGYHFAGRGFPLEAVLVWVPGFIFNIAVVAIFLPGHKAYVAALASSIAYALVLLFHMRLFAQESGGYRVLRPRLREVASLMSELARQLLIRLRSARRLLAS